jgi:hypothetical protein
VSLISFGSINYQTREVSIIFESYTDSLSTVSFTYSYSQSEETILDKQAFATVNYTTGEYTINTTYDKSVTEVVSSSAQLNINNFGFGIPEGTSLVPASVNLTFFLPDGSSYTAKDVVDLVDPTKGYFSETTNIYSSEIDYDNKTFSVVFNTYTSFLNDITISYQYRVVNPPDINTNIYAEYITENNIKITEAGIIDSFGNMIAYATFPPIEMNDAKFHTTYQFLIYNGSFN